MNPSAPTFWLPEAASTSAGRVDAGWGLALWVAVATFLVVVTAMAALVVRYRRRNEGEIPAGPQRLRKLEMAFAILPAVLVAVLFLAGFKGFIDQQIAPANALAVSVTAEKTAWSFEYANGATAVDELRVPVGQPVMLTMTSKDVIHGFSVPEFRVKKDIVPGSSSTVWFEPTQEGTLSFACTGTCGVKHAAQNGKVVVMNAREFGDWLDANGDKLPPVQSGEKLATKFACNTCHTVDGKPGTGPTWKALGGAQVELADGSRVVADDAFLRESITEPNAKIVKGFQPLMPAFKSQLTPKQIDALVAYIKSLN
ncbi:MAG: c-type cytochrome [Myxococcales bacterium]